MRRRWISAANFATSSRSAIQLRFVMQIALAGFVQALRVVAQALSARAGKRSFVGENRPFATFQFGFCGQWE